MRAEALASSCEFLTAHSTVAEYECGELVFAPTEKPRSVYLLVRGSIRRYRVSEEGCEVSLGYVAPGELFGEVALLAQRACEDFAEAAAPSAVAAIAAPRFMNFVATQPGVVIEMMRGIAARLQRAEGRVETMVFRDARSRVARALLELADEFGSGDAGAMTIDLDLTQTHLAALAGTTRQTVNLSLRQWEREGLTTRRRRRIVVLDHERLLRASSNSG